MKRTAAWLAVHALEQLGVEFTFGIPGVHNTELYDELNNSSLITPILVTHEGCASFMADAVSRIGGKGIGVLAIVPAAGFTHAASGIGEAFLDGIPMLVISGGIRTNIDKRYQLHEIDQLELAKPLTKAAFRISRYEDVVPTFFEAYRIATGGEPGPVFIELPVNLQMIPGDFGALPLWSNAPAPQSPDPLAIRQAAEMLVAAKHPGLFVGWGARSGSEIVAAIAELLEAPVSTTLQGLAAFPADHPLHAGFTFGLAAAPAARNAFRECDCLLAVGTCFGEIATGSYSVDVPAKLIHIDINPAAFDANYPAMLKIAGDAKVILKELLSALQIILITTRPRIGVSDSIAKDKAAYRQTWYSHDTKGRVSPATFFDALRNAVAKTSIAVIDDGNHTYLTAELFPVFAGGSLIVPTDFNAMGYAVPAAIGAKLARPEREVFAIIGDGAFMMTCMELITATRLGLGLICFIFHDGELSQIAQAQEIPYNRKPCTTIGHLNIEGVALATGAAYLALDTNEDCLRVISEARQLAAVNGPVVVDVKIDYSKRTAFTEGAVKANFRRFPLVQRLRMVGRAVKRRITG